MELGNTSYRILALVRTIDMDIYGWGVQVKVTDRTDGYEKPVFQTRNFSTTKNYPTIEDNIVRGMKYFRAPKKEINYMVNLYRLNKVYTEQEIREELKSRPWFKEGVDYDFDCLVNHVNNNSSFRLSLADRIDEFENLPNI